MRRGRTRLAWAAGAAAAFLGLAAGCASGGGGGGGAETKKFYDGPDTPAVLTPTSTGAFMNALIGVDSAIVALKAGRAPVAAPRADLSRQPVARGAVIATLDDLDNGLLGGTRRISGTLADDGTGTLLYEYDGFNNSGDVFNGRYTLHVFEYHVVAGRLLFLHSTAVIPALRVTGPGGDITTSGVLSIERSLNGDKTTTANTDARDNLSGITYRTQNMVKVHVEAGCSDSTTGRLYISTYGYVEVHTVQPLSRRLCIDESPNGGGPLVIEGAASAARLFPMTRVRARVERDADGDGVFESAAVYRYDGLIGPPAPNAAPIAVATGGAGITEGETAHLSGGASSDPDGDPLILTWSVGAAPAGSAPELLPVGDSPFIAARFTPDLPGSYTIMLVASDGFLDSAPALLVLDVNGRPTADAGPDRIVAQGVPEVLDGTGSFDPEGDPLSFHWSLTSIPVGNGDTLFGSVSPTPTMTANVVGDYVATLWVSDALSSSDLDTVTLTLPGLLHPRVPVPPVAFPPMAVAFGDVTGDGRPDLVVHGGVPPFPGSHMLAVLPGLPGGGLGGPVAYDLSAIAFGPGSDRSIDLGDVNGDGRMDVVVTVQTGSGVMLQNAAGLLQPLAVHRIDLSAPVAAPIRVRTGDLNGDGRTDIAMIQWGGADALLQLQNPDGTLAPTVSVAAPHGGGDNLAVGDLNHDGRQDLVVLSGDGTFDPVRVLYQGADGTLGSPVSHVLGAPGGAVARGLAIGDVTGDGLPDVVVTYGGGFNAGIAVFPQVPAGGLSSVPVHYPSHNTPGEARMADLDGDGGVEVLVVHGGSSTIGVYRQLPDGTLAPELRHPIAQMTDGLQDHIAVGDVDGDEGSDAVIAIRLDGTYLLSGVGPP